MSKDLRPIPREVLDSSPFSLSPFPNYTFRPNHKRRVSKSIQPLTLIDYTEDKHKSKLYGCQLSPLDNSRPRRHA